MAGNFRAAKAEVNGSRWSEPEFPALRGGRPRLVGGPAACLRQTLQTLYRTTWLPSSAVDQTPRGRACLRRSKAEVTPLRRLWGAVWSRGMCQAMEGSGRSCRRSDGCAERASASLMCRKRCPAALQFIRRWSPSFSHDGDAHGAPLRTIELAQIDVLSMSQYHIPRGDRESAVASGEVRFLMARGVRCHGTIRA